MSDQTRSFCRRFFLISLMFMNLFPLVFFITSKVLDRIRANIVFDVSIVFELLIIFSIVSE